MKTPWRFLTDLVSRKSDVPDVSPAARDEIKAVNHVETSVTAVKEPEDGPSDRHGEESVAVAVETLPEELADQGAPDEIDTGSAIDMVPEDDNGAIAESPSEEQLDTGHVDVPDRIPSEISADESVASGKESYSKRKARAKSSNDGAGGERQAEVLEPVVSATSPEKSAFDELVALDTEISVLRAALAKKLSVQNEQLRRMLARYD